MNSSPRLLLLETSGRVGVVAVAKGASLLAEKRLDQAQRHARDLAPAIAQLLAGQGWAARELDGVFVSRGPGSYTGLRVGLMSAKTLAFTIGCPLILIDTFAAIARQTPKEVDRVDILGDAQQDKVYVESFKRLGERWSSVKPLTIVRFVDWLAEREQTAWVSGPGLQKWSSQIVEAVPIVAESLRDPQALSVLALGLERLNAGERDDPILAEPLYLRPSSAEEQWAARQGK